MKSLRLAMIIQGYHPAIGGAEKQLKSLVPFLRKEDCDIHILTRHKSGLLYREELDGATIHRIPAFGTKATASLLFTIGSVIALRTLKPDIIHAHELLSPTTTAVVAGRITRAPVVAKVLGGGCLGDLAKLKRERIGQKRIQLYARNVNRFIAVSSEIDRELASVGIPPEKRCSIPNGVDTNRFCPPDELLKNKRRKELSLEGDPIGIYTGRLAKEKRLDFLVEAWRGIQNQYPRASLYLIGTGEEETLLKEMQTVGIRVLPPVEDVAPYLQAADLFVLPSEREGLSNSMLEAMSCGLPVIATDVGGARDVVRDGCNGFLVPVENPNLFQKTLLSVIGNPSLRRAIGAASSRTILEKYSLSETAKTLRCLYDSLLMQSVPSKNLGIVCYE